MKRIDEYKESIRDLEKWQAYYTPSGQIKGTTTWEKDHWKSRGIHRWY